MLPHPLDAARVHPQEVQVDNIILSLERTHHCGLPEGDTQKRRYIGVTIIRTSWIIAIMSLATLTYQHDSHYEGTRDGLPVYDGSASGFHDWLFRVEVKWNAAKEDDKKTVMARVIEGLRGDAKDIARDIGVTDLLADDGFKKLKEAIRKNIFPKKLAEAKVLYKHGHKKKGVLSRQPAEPMITYISRRQRW